MKSEVKLSWHPFVCAGKLSDALYVPPWRIATGEGKGRFPLDCLPTGYQEGTG
ncbi:MAG: hypothetical protein VCF25_14685 [Candidatus Poribacteria bacterium]